MYQIYRQLVARRFQSITFIANSLGDKGPSYLSYFQTWLVKYALRKKMSLKKNCWKLKDL